MSTFITVSILDFGRGKSKMSYRYNVSCSNTVSKNWTPAAIDCYKLGCVCSKCNLYKIYFSEGSFRCRMKETVIELVRKYGVPKGEDL